METLLIFLRALYPGAKATECQYVRQTTNIPPIPISARAKKNAWGTNLWFDGVLH
jgi:hypothetical protein